MQKWEYKTIYETKGFAIRSIEEQMKDLGLCGWELISCYVNTTSSIVYVFKRPL